MVGPDGAEAASGCVLETSGPLAPGCCPNGGFEGRLLLKNDVQSVGAVGSTVATLASPVKDNPAGHQVADGGPSGEPDPWPPSDSSQDLQRK